MDPRSNVYLNNEFKLTSQSLIHITRFLVLQIITIIIITVSNVVFLNSVLTVCVYKLCLLFIFSYQKTESVIKTTAEKTTSLLGGFGSTVSSKLGQLKNSESFRSFEERVGSAYENVKVTQP